MSMKYIEKSIHVIKFSGLHNDWKYWLHKFLARASKRSYRQILDGTSTISTKMVYDQANLTQLPTADEKSL